MKTTETQYPWINCHVCGHKLTEAGKCFRCDRTKCCSTLSKVLGTCLRNATVEVDGKPYCRQHDPAVAAEKARQRRAERESHEAATEAEWKQNYARWKLIELIRAADDTGGKVFIKPAGKKAEQRFCIPVDLWMQIREALTAMDGEESDAAKLVEINPYDREGIDE